MLKCGAYNFRISNGPFPTVPLCLRMNSKKNHMFFVCGPACTYLRHPPWFLPESHNPPVFPRTGWNKGRINLSSCRTPDQFLANSPFPTESEANESNAVTTGLFLSTNASRSIIGWFPSPQAVQIKSTAIDTANVFMILYYCYLQKYLYLKQMTRILIQKPASPIFYLIHVSGLFRKFYFKFHLMK